ncbi:MAG: hypothetical protein GY953_18640, partial [bacterium]|nr:hypothetical protein [bacterium]
SLFLIYTAKPLSELLGRDAIEAHALDDEAIMSQLHVDAGGDEVDIDAMRRNYLDMKREARIYQTYDAAVEMAGSRFSVTADWPKEAPPGTYQVVAYECRDGAIVSERSASLELLSIGFPATVYALAMENAPLYGGLAVILAVCAGFFIDFLASRLFGARSKVVH